MTYIGAANRHLSKRIKFYNENVTKTVFIMGKEITYDEVGNPTKYYNSGAGTTAAKNPFRYRGYYYDIDLGLYYLNARYYDSNVGRFISADAQLSIGSDLLGANLFTYRCNNPVNYKQSLVSSSESVISSSICKGGHLLR